MYLPARIEIKPSAKLAAFLFAGHGLGAVAICGLELGLMVRGAMLFAIGGSALASVNRSLKRSHNAVTGLVLQSNGRVILVRRNGKTEEAGVLARTFVSPWLVILVTRTIGTVETQMLMRDSFDEEGYRQLRIWLRLQGETANSPQRL